MVISKQIELLSDGHFNVMVITDTVAEFVQESGLKNGQVFVFYQHTTGAVIVSEHETGIVADMQDMFEEIAPFHRAYKHHIRAVDFNGQAHLRSALLGSQVSLPVIDGKIAKGTYQDIIVLDDQVDAEPRYLVLQVMGE